MALRLLPLDWRHRRGRPENTRLQTTEEDWRPLNYRLHTAFCYMALAGREGVKLSLSIEYTNEEDRSHHNS